MDLRIIRVTLELDQEGLQVLDLGPDCRSALLSANSEPRPVAFVLRQEDLSKLSACLDLIVDRDWKLPARGLKSYFVDCRVGRGRIQLIRYNYSTSRKASRSVRDFLAAAREAGQPGLYLIACNRPIVESLWDEAPHLVPPLTPPTPPTPIDPPARQTDPEADWQRLFKLARKVVIHEEIEKLYVGNSEPALQVKREATLAARVSSNVVIAGETGTGKELIARGIHEASGRPGEFVPVNCIAIPGGLFEPEMFGVVPGAYTGATRQTDGYFQQAHGGSLFLDEVQDLSLENQGKLRRVLEDCIVKRVGAKQSHQLDVRIIAATNKDLLTLVTAGEFREDLYHRLKLIEIRTPSLPQISEDIRLLLLHLWAQIPGTEPGDLLPEVLDDLCRRSWPGNARQLRNLLRAMHAMMGRDLTVEIVRAWLAREDRPTPTEPPAPASAPVPRTFWDRCEAHIRRADKAARSAQIALTGVSAPVSADEVRVITGKMKPELQELEELCRTTVDFAGKFKLVQLVKNGIRTFLVEFQSQQAEALARWKREVDPACDALFLAFASALERIAEKRASGETGYRQLRTRRATPTRKRSHGHGKGEMILGQA